MLASIAPAAGTKSGIADQRDREREGEKKLKARPNKQTIEKIKRRQAPSRALASLVRWPPTFTRHVYNIYIAFSVFKRKQQQHLSLWAWSPGKGPARACCCCCCCCSAVRERRVVIDDGCCCCCCCRAMIVCPPAPAPAPAPASTTLIASIVNTLTYFFHISIFFFFLFFFLALRPGLALNSPACLSPGLVLLLLEGKRSVKWIRRGEKKDTESRLLRLKPAVCLTLSG